MPFALSLINVYFLYCYQPLYYAIIFLLESFFLFFLCIHLKYYKKGLIDSVTQNFDRLIKRKTISSNLVFPLVTGLLLAHLKLAVDCRSEHNDFEKSVYKFFGLRVVLSLILNNEKIRLIFSDLLNDALIKEKIIEIPYFWVIFLLEMLLCTSTEFFNCSIFLFGHPTNQSDSLFLFLFFNSLRIFSTFLDDIVHSCYFYTDRLSDGKLSIIISPHYFSFYSFLHSYDLFLSTGALILLKQAFKIQLDGMMSLNIMLLFRITGKILCCHETSYNEKTIMLSNLASHKNCRIREEAQTYTKYFIL